MNTWQLVLQQVLNTGVLISVLMLTALGLGIIYGLMDVLNLAHGEFLMLGAYGVVVGTNLHLATWEAMILSTAMVGLFGFVLERTLMRLLYKRPIDSLLATWGVSLILVQVIQIVFSPVPQTVISPVQGPVFIGGLPFPKYNLFVMIFGVCLTLAVLAFLRYPTFGLKSRAVFQDSEMATSLGIRSPRIYSASFVLGASLAGLAGALVAPLVNVQPTMGSVYLVNSFLTVIVGGVGNLAGIMGGAGVIGGSEGVIGYFSSGLLAQVIVLTIAIAIVRLRPKGIFVRK